MQYTFEILGVSPVLDLFNRQQELHSQSPVPNMEYVGIYRCTLDASLESVEQVTRSRTWDRDRVVRTVVDFWMNNPESIWYWKERLHDAGTDNLLMARVSHTDALRRAFESLFHRNNP